MRMMKSPMAVRNPSTSGETGEHKLNLINVGIMGALLMCYTSMTKMDVSTRLVNKRPSYSVCSRQEGTDLS